MNLSNYTAARAKFFSPLESIGEFNLVGTDINENMTLKLKSLKSLLSYTSAVLTREPIITSNVSLLKPGTISADEYLTYDAFLNTTKLNNDLSFYFQATTFVNKAPLTFSDRGLLGDKNTYKPFDSAEVKSVDSMITGTIDDIRVFSEDNFKYKHFRGTAAFNRVTTHKKGYTMYLTDKALYVTIIASRHTIKTGITSYIAVMYIGD